MNWPGFYGELMRSSSATRSGFAIASSKLIGGAHSPDEMSTFSRTNRRTAADAPPPHQYFAVSLL
jgi:hypothetical protein